MTEDHSGRGAERHAELGFKRCRRPIVDEQPRRHRVHFDIDSFDILRRQVVALLQREQCVQRRVRCRARRKELHCDAGVENFPARTQVRNRVAQRRRRLLTIHCRQVTLRTLDCLHAGNETRFRKASRHHAISGGHAGMQRLDHTAEVFLEPACRRRRNSQSVNRLGNVEAQKPRSGCCRAQRPDRRGAMPSSLMIVTRIHHQSQPAFELEPYNVGVENVPA
jgi:hypothetical protein